MKYWHVCYAVTMPQRTQPPTTREPLTRGARRKSLYSRQSCITRVHSAFSCAKLAQQWRCAALVPRQHAASLILGHAGFEEVFLLSDIRLFIQPGQGALSAREWLVFDKQILVGRFDRRRDTTDVGNSRCRRDSQAVGMAHADALHALPQALPFERGARIDVQESTAFLP